MARAHGVMLNPSFNVGEKAVYPTHGVAEVVALETKVIEGEVDHRDYVLTEKEQQANDCMMVCVSRACGKRLVLGL